MAKITQYQQGRLADSSSVTQPRTLDTNAQVLGGIASQAGAIGDTLAGISSKLFETQLDERKRKEAEARAYAKQIATAEQDAYVANKMSSVNVEATNAAVQLKQQHEMNTDGVVNSFQNSYLDLQQRTLEGETDPLTRAKLDKALATNRATYTDNLQRWTEERQVPIMKDRVTGISQNFAMELGNYGLSAAEVGQKVQAYKSNNEKLYSFTMTPENVKAQMQKDTEDGVLNWLHDTAMKQPAVLDQRVESVRGLVEKKALDTFYAKEKQVAREIEHLDLEKGKKESLAAQLEVGQKIIQSSPTGDWKDADPRVVEEVLKQNGSKLPVAQQIRYKQIHQEALSETSKTEKKNFLQQEEVSIAKNFGRFAAQEAALGSRVDSIITQLSKAKGRDKAALLPGLQSAIDQYQDSYTNLNALKNSFQDKDAKRIADLQLKAANERFGAIVGKLNGSPIGAETRQVQSGLYSSVAPTDKLYPDAKRNALYQLFYQNAFYDFIQQRKLKPETMQALQKNKMAVKALRNTLHKEAYQLMQTSGAKP